jgi:hypothetical protein
VGKKMDMRKFVYKAVSAILSAAMLAAAPGCAVKEDPAPISTPIPEDETPLPTPTFTVEPTPTLTPEPTPDLTFTTMSNIDNADILYNQAQLIINKIKNSNVNYPDSLKNIDVNTMMNYLKWCTARIPNDEICIENAQGVLDNFINQIGNEELKVLWAILEGRREPIENADFVGCIDLMPLDSAAYKLETKLNEIKNELASFPSKERQIELAQEASNLALDFMLSNDDRKDDGRSSENSDIETMAFKVSIWFDFITLLNSAYIINPNLVPQYPVWHEKHPNSMDINQYNQTISDFFDFIYYNAPEVMADECLRFVSISTPTLNPKK